METRANFVLIGAFTLLGILGILGSILWFAKVQVDRHYAYYDVLFDSVSGLGEAGDVRYNGLPVGQVVSLGLDADDSSKVRVRIEIDAATPVRTDTEATLELQGVTGVSYVSLSGGSPDKPLLRVASKDAIPVIAARTSAVQNLLSAAPELIGRAIDLIEDLRKMTGPENRTAVGNILSNLESASNRLDGALIDFSALSADLRSASQKIAGFTDQLEPVSKSADETLKTARSAIEKAQETVDQATAALASARQTFDSANALMKDQLPDLIAQIDSTAGTIETVVSDVGGRAGAAIGKIEEAAVLATARLSEAQATIARVDTTLETATAAMTSIDETAGNLNTLVTGDGAALVAEARMAVAAANTALATVNTVIREDLPTIVAEIRRTTENVNGIVAKVGADLSSVSGRLDGLATNADAAILVATDSFRRASDTLAAINQTMTVADGMLTAARATFDGASRIVNEDAGAIVADVRSGVASLNDAIGKVSDDLPQITGELRETVLRAQSFIESLDNVVVSNTPQIQAFMQSGLPQFVRFVQEGSKLVESMQRLTAKIERDPARFLLGTQAPEYRK